MKIFCDLDGTLIDVAIRHYRVYSETIHEFNGTPLGQTKYWELKRNKAKWSFLLPLSGVASESENKFLERFKDKIENPEYLKLDTLFPNVVMTLEKLRELGDCYLVTLRRNRKNVLEELDYLDLSHQFTEVLTGHSESDGYDVKISLIRDKLDDAEGIIIGDTEADIITGKELGLRTFAVRTGIRDDTFLKQLHPDHIISEFADVTRYI